MPFEVKISEATLVGRMGKILARMNNGNSYINNLIIHTNDSQAHLQISEKLLQCLQEAGLTAKSSKCVFEAKSVEFLGHFISHDWVMINEDNIVKICTVQRQTKKKEDRFWSKQTRNIPTLPHKHPHICSAID